MKSILCFGDSNTWGYSPSALDRYPVEDRWVSVLQKSLGDEYLIIPEGLNGRTTIFDDDVEGKYKNGERILFAVIESHKPLDTVIIMLGTNDLKKRFNASAKDIANGAGRLVEIVQKSSVGVKGNPPNVILIAPPRILKRTGFGNAFDGGYEKSLEFSTEYEKVAKKLGCNFIDADSIIESSERDGIHLEASEHKKLGKAVAEYIIKNF